MSILTGIRTLFLAEETITDLVATNGVHVNTIPQSAADPYVLLTLMSQDNALRLEGTGGLLFTDIDIDCKAVTHAKASALADAIEAYFGDYTGAAGDQTVGAVLLNDRDDDYEAPQNKTDKGLHVVTLDVQVQWRP